MRYKFAVASLLTLMLGLQIYSAKLETQTYDEAVHLAAGYSYWKTGHYRLNPEHPPLQKLLSALPLLWLHPELPLEHETWKNGDQYEFARVFLYRGRHGADRLLFWGRLPTMLISLMLGLAIAFYTAIEFGERAALTATALYALDGNIIAHGRYVTTDVIAALFFFLTCMLWMRGRTVWAGAAMGAGLLSKFSLVVLIPLLLLLGWRRWKQWMIVMVTGAAVVLAVYLPDGLGAWWTGFQDVVKHSESGQPTYLLGTVSDTGSWKYFPVAFAVKTPSALLLLLPLAVVLLRGHWLWIPPIIYFGLSLTSKLNIGLRHILPIYPFLIVLAAAAVWRLRPRTALFVAVAAVGMQAAEAARVHPHYLAFFNTLAGGPEAGPRYLLDSNIDWGQDVKKLKHYMDAQGLDKVCLSYFGYTDVPYYGVKEEYVPRTHELEQRKNLNCMVAISVTLLNGLYFPPGTFDWLRERQPAGNIGYSIYLFDLRKPAPAVNP